MTITKAKFIKDIAAIAVKRYSETKVLPSMTIAQGCLETGYGQKSDLVPYYNWFGLKWMNDSITKQYKSVDMKTWEVYDGVREDNIDALWCVFDNLEQCMDCYYAWLNRTSSPWYAKIHGETDYKLACEYIDKSPYATDPEYGEKLVRIIESNNLTVYDQKVLNTSNTSTESKMYYVQVGAFDVLDNAKRLALDISSRGHDCLIKDATVEKHRVYRCQTGAYEKHENAEKALKEIQSLGGIYSGAFINDSGGTDVKMYKAK